MQWLKVHWLACSHTWDGLSCRGSGIRSDFLAHELTSAQYVTRILQSLYYRLTIPAGRPHPQPGHPLYAYHHRRIRIFVLCLYLVYTFVQTLYDIRLSGDLYTVLGVTPYSSEKEVRARFRRLAARFHPDKIRETDRETTSDDAAFVTLKLAQDTILDPTKRFAYDRFGPAILRVQHPGLRSIRDYVYAGLRSLIPEYLKGAVTLVGLNYFWLPTWGQYWRYLAIAGLLFLELYFLTHTWEPQQYMLETAKIARALIPGIFPDHLLPFQILNLARRMSLSVNIFISQLAPPTARNKADEDRQAHHQLAHLNQAATRLETEVSSILQLGLVPFKGEPDKIELLKRGIKENIMLSAVRNSDEVKEAVKRVVDRRRTHAEPRDAA